MNIKGGMGNIQQSGHAVEDKAETEERSRGNKDEKTKGEKVDLQIRGR